MKTVKIGVCAMTIFMGIGLEGYCIHYQSGAPTDPATATATSKCGCTLYACLSSNVWKLSDQKQGKGTQQPKTFSQTDKCPVCGHAVTDHKYNADGTAILLGEMFCAAQ